VRLDPALERHIGDIDLLVASDAREPIVEAFTEWPEADATTIEAGTGRRAFARAHPVDLRIVDGEEFGAALQYFTGSRAHNVAVRNRAIDRGLKLNEYGLFDISDVDDPDAGQRVGERVAGETEDGVYEALDMDPVPPELRENNGEVAAAAAGELPNLVETKDLRGDLHTHTDWSDGGFSIAEMIEAAAERGYDAHAVTDHAAGPGIFGNTGLDEAEIAAQADAVADAIDAVDGAVWAGEGGAGESGAGEPTRRRHRGVPRDRGQHRRGGRDHHRRRHPRRPRYRRRLAALRAGTGPRRRHGRG